MVNPFAPPQIDFAGNINDIIQNRRRDLLFQEQQQQYQKQQQLQETRKSALQDLMSGDGSTDPTQKIMGYLQKTGDLEGAQGLATVVKTMRGQQLTPDAILRHQDFQAGLTQRQQAAEETPDIKNYKFWLQQQGQTTTPTAAEGAAPPDTSFGAYMQHKKDKPPPPKDFMDNKYKIISGGLDAMIQNIDDLTGSDQLGSVTGLAGSIWKPPGSPGRGLQVKQKQLADQAKLATFQDLKDAATTGSAGFGRLAVVEFNSMNQRIAALDAAQDEPSYRRELKKLRDWASGAKERLSGQLSKDYEGGGQSVPVPTSPVEMPQGMQPIATPPPDSVVPAAALSSADPRKWSDQQIISQARDMAQNKNMTKDQIINWFAQRGVKIEP